MSQDILQKIVKQVKDLMELEMAVSHMEHAVGENGIVHSFPTLSPPLMLYKHMHHTRIVFPLHFSVISQGQKLLGKQQSS